MSDNIPVKLTLRKNPLMILPGVEPQPTVKRVLHLTVSQGADGQYFVGDSLIGEHASADTLAGAFVAWQRELKHFYDFAQEAAGHGDKVKDDYLAWLQGYISYGE